MRVELGQHRGVKLHTELTKSKDKPAKLTTYAMDIRGNKFTVFSDNADHQQMRRGLVKLVDVVLDTDYDKFYDMRPSPVLHSGSVTISHNVYLEDVLAC